MTAPPLHAAIIGLGDWAEDLAGGFSASAGLKLHACFTRNVEKRTAFARKHGCHPAASYEALLEDPDLSVVVITAPDDAHAELTMQAAAAGKHVLVEKPMAMNVAQCEEMISACRAADVRLGMSGLHFRFLHSIQQAESIIASGRLGEIVSVSGYFCAERGKGIPPEAWRSSRRRCPAGALSPLGVHIIDLCNHLLAPRRPRHVSAFMSRKVMPGESANVVSLMVRYDHDVVATIQAAHVVPWHVGLTVFGTRNNLSFMSPMPMFNPVETGQLKLQPAGGDRWDEIALQPRPVITLQLDAFAEAVRSGVNYAIQGEDGRRAVAVIESAVTSAATGAVVPVEAWIRPGL